MQERRRAVGAIVALIALTSGAAAQDSAAAPRSGNDTTITVDRVIAVVGNRPILTSQIEEKVFAMEAEGRPLPKDSAGKQALRRQVIDETIDEELLVQQAERDTLIKVTEEEISEGVAEQVRSVRRKYTSEADYRAGLRKAGFQTVDEYRRWLADQQRRAQLQNRLIEKLRSEGKLKPVRPTDQEMRAFFDDQKSAMGKHPATLAFQQVVVTPKATPAAKEKAKALADSLATELRNGANFAAAARRFSADSVSRELGGDLNWFRRGVMVTEFERVAFALKPGTISNPVETPFGYHIIQVQRVQPSEVQARHILIVPDVDSIRIDSARALADSVYRAITNGAPFDSLQRLYHDRSSERTAENVPIDRLPEEYAKAVGSADSGAIIPVFRLPAAHRPQFVILKVGRRRPEGTVKFEDVKDGIFDRLGKQFAIRQYIDRLKSATFVEVRS